jgi:hypothetical protein
MVTDRDNAGGLAGISPGRLEGNHQRVIPLIVNPRNDNLSRGAIFDLKPIGPTQFDLFLFGGMDLQCPGEKVVSRTIQRLIGGQFTMQVLEPHATNK